MTLIHVAVADAVDVGLLKMPVVEDIAREERKLIDDDNEVAANEKVAKKIEMSMRLMN